MRIAVVLCSFCIVLCAPLAYGSGSGAKISIFSAHIAEAAKARGVTIYRQACDFKEAGYSGVEVFETDNDESIASLRKAGLEVPVMVAWPSFQDKYNEEWATNIIARVIQLKIPKIMLVPGFYTEKGDHEVEFSLMAKRTERFAQEAKSKGIVVMVEDFDSEFSPTKNIKLLRRFLDEAPTCRLVFDTGNFDFSGENEIEALKVFKGEICHYHLKDIDKVIKRKSVPVGSGKISISHILNSAISEGYDGWFTVEHFGCPDMAAAAKASIDYLHKK